MHVWSCAPGSQAGNVHDNIRQTQQQIRKYLCALLGTAQSRENGELWWHFSPGIHEIQGFSTVDRLGACKSKESGDSCCGVQIPSVQYGEEICQSVYSSHSSAQKHDLLKENLEMQLLPHFKKGRKKKKDGGGRRKKPKRNQTKKPREPFITMTHPFKMWVFSTWQPIFQGYTAAQGRIGSRATRRGVSGPGCSEKKREKRKEKMTGEEWQGV